MLLLRGFFQRKERRGRRGATQRNKQELFMELWDSWAYFIFTRSFSFADFFTAKNAEGYAEERKAKGIYLYMLWNGPAEKETRGQHAPDYSPLPNECWCLLNPYTIVPPSRIFLPQRMQRDTLRNAKQQAGIVYGALRLLGFFHFYTMLLLLRIFFTANSAEGGAQECEANEQESPIFFRWETPAALLI